MQHAAAKPLQYLLRLRAAAGQGRAAPRRAVAVLPVERLLTKLRQHITPRMFSRASKETATGEGAEQSCVEF